ncbi:helix-turn-helix domain-containing protein [Comamonas aquatilis]|uniref:helix-turn-helix domain-containing protein n=1 Tax=Comamonas aquatilis TaxID=1778406 RepID=UPI0039EEE92D
MTDTINAKQCAELLFCDVTTIEALARKGELPGLKFGRGWVFFRTDLLLYLAERARQAAERRCG